MSDYQQLQEAPPDDRWSRRHPRLLRFLRWVALVIFVLAFALIVADIGYHLTLPS